MLAKSVLPHICTEAVYERERVGVPVEWRRYCIPGFAEIFGGVGGDGAGVFQTEFITSLRDPYF